MEDQEGRREQEPTESAEPVPVRPSVPPVPASSQPRPAPAPPPPEAWQRPVRVEPVPGTPYGLAVLGAPAAASGAAVGALVAGISSILVVTLVGCFGLAGADAGWGLWVAGAFAVLAGGLGGAGVWLGVVGLRQTRRGRAGVEPALTGRGMAVAGLVCGGAALVIMLCTLAGVAAVQLT